MKYRFILIITAGLLLGMVSCKKGNTNSNNSALNGKWQQTKLRMYIVDSGKITNDTTYLQPFTNLDYIQFGSFGTCSISSDHYYYNMPGEPKTPQLIDQNISDFKYSAIAGGKFVLNSSVNLVNPGGFISTDTITQVNANNIILHNVGWGHVPGYYSVTDSYYEK
jgi:hypothetical protein